MRHGALLACRVKPSGWAHATRLTYAPRQCLLRPCTLQLSTSGQRRLLQSTSRLDNLKTSAQNDQSSRGGAENGSVRELSQSATVDVNDQSSLGEPAKDHSWVFANAGDHIETINGRALQGIEEFVTHNSGVKLLCSWNIGRDDEPTIWVPGDAPRVRDLKLPVDLKPEAMQDTPNSDWTLGSPLASFEPFFASLAAMNPLANFDDTDVIVRSGTLYLLLGVARGSIKQLGASSTAVAFHITLVKDTLIIKRILNPTHGLTLGRGSTPTMNTSFMNKITEMKTFEQNFSPDHSQAVRYDIGNLRCVVIKPVHAATGNASLPPVTVAMPQAAGSVKVVKGGRGVPPSAVTRLMTGAMGSEINKRRLNYRGELKIKPAGQAKIYFERPKTILQGHLEPRSPSATEPANRLARISVREVEPMLDQTENACQLELRRLVTLLDRLRDTARRVGGSCILACLPEQKSESGVKSPAKFELYKCGPGAAPLVLDWHVERFWSKK